jgi:hypothetical protein
MFILQELFINDRLCIIIYSLKLPIIKKYKFFIYFNHLNVKLIKEIKKITFICENQFLKPS